MREPAPPCVEEYPRRLEAAQERRRFWGVRERWLSHARLATFVAALAAGWFVFGTRQLGGVWLLLPSLAFLALVIAHDRVIQRHRRAERRESFYAAGIARLEDRWAGSGERGQAFLDPSHPYAEDLDLFGEGSLFELLCTARTPVGEATLARWLLGPASPEGIRARQAAVAELRARLDLHEDLALLGESVRSRMDADALVAWGEAPSREVPRGVRIACAAAASATLFGLVAWVVTPLGPLPFFGALLVQAALASALRRRVGPIIRAVDRPLRGLALLSQLLERMEREPVEADRLVAMRRALETDGRPPSRQIARLRGVADLLDARRNQFFAPIGALLLWSTQLALAVEHWRAQHGSALRDWIDAVGEFEALCSLSTYAYEHPDDPFPEIVEDGARVEGRGLGHPLLPAARCVRNDLALGDERRAFVVSGSNMSGKSTLLRTLGTNAVLALAGAPVRAASLRLSPLAVAASIRVHDSLQHGTSRFYAEIQRLQQVVSLCDGPLPVLFLLDEILHGTNSHDRRIGAEAVIRGLVDRGALGLVTTHDLALARIAEDPEAGFANIHFEDHLEEGRIHFDYQLRPGIVRKSNALELMRAVGLEV